MKENLKTSIKKQRSARSKKNSVKEIPCKTLINWSLVDEMLLDMCEANEIAAALCVSHEILMSEVFKRYKVEFEVYRDKKRAETIQNLRKAQLKLSESNSSMSVWLGKQYLGQKDKHENSGSTGHDRSMPQIVIELHGAKSNLLNTPPAAFGNVITENSARENDPEE